MLSERASGIGGGRPVACGGAATIGGLGRVSIVTARTGLDNVTFLDADRIAFVEDAGDTLHTQRSALDSGYVFDLRLDYSRGAQPVRFLAEGRDPSATLDSALSAYSGFQNDGDNEITGIQMSDLVNVHAKAASCPARWVPWTDRQGLVQQGHRANLVIAQRAAEAHVQHILARLGFSSRAQIAALIGQAVDRMSIILPQHKISASEPST